jgi:hypothetical protein
MNRIARLPLEAYVLKRLPLAENADACDQLMPWNTKPEDLITEIGSLKDPRLWIAYSHYSFKSDYYSMKSIVW